MTIKTSQKVKQIVCIDWLTIALNGSPPVDHKNNECYIVQTQETNLNFRFVSDLYVNTIKVGKLYYQPLKSYMPKDLMHLTIANEILYTTDLQNYIKYLLKIGDYKQVVRLDLAIDYLLSNQNLVKKTINLLNNKNVVKKGKAEYESHNIGLTSLIYGSSKSNKQINIYNKTEELKQSNKPYINRFHFNNGLIVNKNDSIQRFELRLRKAATKSIDITKLNDSNYLKHLIMSNIKNFYDFKQRKKENYKTIVKNVTPLKLDHKINPEYLPIEQTIKATTNNLNRGEIIGLKAEYTKYLINYLKHINVVNLRHIDPKETTSYLEASNKHMKAINAILEANQQLTIYYNAKSIHWEKEVKKKYKAEIEQKTESEASNRITDITIKCNSLNSK
jgi:Replication initiation factor.